MSGSATLNGPPRELVRVDGVLTATSSPRKDLRSAIAHLRSELEHGERLAIMFRAQWRSSFGRWIAVTNKRLLLVDRDGRVSFSTTPQQADIERLILSVRIRPHNGTPIKVLLHTDNDHQRDALLEAFGRIQRDEERVIAEAVDSVTPLPSEAHAHSLPRRRPHAPGDEAPLEVTDRDDVGGFDTAKADTHRRHLQGEPLLLHERGYYVTATRLVAPSEKTFQLAQLVSCEVEEFQRAGIVREWAHPNAAGYKILGVMALILGVALSTEADGWLLAIGLVVGIWALIKSKKHVEWGVVGSVYRVIIRYSNHSDVEVAESYDEAFARQLHGAITEGIGPGGP